MIPVNVLTLDDVSSVRGKLQTIKDSFYAKGKVSEEALAREWGIGSPQDAVEAIKMLDGMEIVKTTFAVRPAPNLVKEISDQVAKIAGRKLILDIKIDPQIIGGAEISFAGRYLDLTLRKKLDEI